MFLEVLKEASPSCSLSEALARYVVFVAFYSTFYNFLFLLFFILFFFISFFALHLELTDLIAMLPLAAQYASDIFCRFSIFSSKTNIDIGSQGGIRSCCCSEWDVLARTWTVRRPGEAPSDHVRPASRLVTNCSDRRAGVCLHCVGDDMPIDFQPPRERRRWSGWGYATNHHHLPTCCPAILFVEAR